MCSNLLNLESFTHLIRNKQTRGLPGQLQTRGLPGQLQTRGLPDQLQTRGLTDQLQTRGLPGHLHGDCRATCKHSMRLLLLTEENQGRQWNVFSLYKIFDAQFSIIYFPFYTIRDFIYSYKHLNCLFLLTGMKYNDAICFVFFIMINIKQLLQNRERDKIYFC